MADESDFDSDSDPIESDQVSAERPYYDDGFRPSRQEVERENVIRALRNARPSFLGPALDSPERRFGESFFERGPQIDLASRERRYGDSFFRKQDFPPGSVTTRQRFPFFPEDEPAEAAQVVAARAIPDIAFISSNASTTSSGVVTRKVKVFDGKINGQFPAGMGFNNYILTLANPEDSLIYAGATFNPETLAITSRFLGVSTASEYPESRVDEEGGFLYWLLSFTFLDGDTFKVYNARVGDINFELVYGSMNGQPALLPVNTDPGWLDLEQFQE